MIGMFELNRRKLTKRYVKQRMNKLRRHENTRGTLLNTGTYKHKFSKIYHLNVNNR